MARTVDDLPCATCPMVPMLICGGSEVTLQRRRVATGATAGHSEASTYRSLSGNDDRAESVQTLKVDGVEVLDRKVRGVGGREGRRRVVDRRHSTSGGCLRDARMFTSCKRW